MDNLNCTPSSHRPRAFGGAQRHHSRRIVHLAEGIVAGNARNPMLDNNSTDCSLPDTPVSIQRRSMQPSTEGGQGSEPATSFLSLDASLYLSPMHDTPATETMLPTPRLSSLITPVDLSLLSHAPSADGNDADNDPFGFAAAEQRARTRRSATATPHSPQPALLHVLANVPNNVSASTLPDSPGAAKRAAVSDPSSDPSSPSQSSEEYAFPVRKTQRPLKSAKLMEGGLARLPPRLGQQPLDKLRKTKRPAKKAKTAATAHRSSSVDETIQQQQQQQRQAYYENIDAYQLAKETSFDL